MQRTIRTTLIATLMFALVPLTSTWSSAATTTGAGCIVSLSPSATSTLFAIGAGSQVQAVDESSTYPAAAAALAKRHVINGLEPSVEGILGICKVTASHPSTKPDLVVISYNPNDFAQKLEAQGIRVLEQDAATSVAQALDQIRQLGALSGHASQANAVAASMQATIKQAIASVPKPTTPISVFYEISAAPYYSVASTTFVGSMLKALGLSNIADAVSTSADAGYPSLSAEYILSAKPDIIFTAGDATPAQVAARTGFAALPAVQHHDVVELNADLASQWGPRFAQLVTQLAAEVRHVEAQ
jgi:iron complex transport system substrate-binding protein